MAQFQRIGLIASLSQQTVVNSLARLATFLTERGIQVVYEERTAEIVGTADLVSGSAIFPMSNLGEEIDLAIVVGGDGSFISAGRDLVDSDVPILGVNRGRLGFLTDISPDDIEERVGSVLAGDYRGSERSLLRVEVERDGSILDSGLALNDIVLHPGQSVRMMSFDLYIDGKFVYTQDSDGLIVATPTGSTAYALSAGGPILNPELKANVIVPLNPHTLSNRPIVVPGESEIVLVVGDRNDLNPLVTRDGHSDFSIQPSDRVRIQTHSKRLKLIHPSDQNFYESCRSKLGWAATPERGKKA